MKTHPASAKQTTELRLLTATVYFKALNEVHNVMQMIDPLTPVVPITTGTSVAELYADAREHLDNGATQVMIPVISPSNLTLSVVALGNEEVDALGHSEDKQFTPFWKFIPRSAAGLFPSFILMTMRVWLRCRAASPALLASPTPPIAY